MNKEDLFKEFLDGYLENVIKELPDSYRARQLREGGLAKEAVILFETKFLKEPFEKAVEIARKDIEDEILEGLD